MNSDEVTVFYLDLRVSEGDRETLEDVSAVVGPPDQESRGILSWVFSLPGMIVSSVVGVLGLRRLGFIGGGSGG